MPWYDPIIRIGTTKIIAGGTPAGMHWRLHRFDGAAGFAITMAGCDAEGSILATGELTRAVPALVESWLDQVLATKRAECERKTRHAAARRIAPPAPI